MTSGHVATLLLGVLAGYGLAEVRRWVLGRLDCRHRLSDGPLYSDDPVRVTTRDEDGRPVGPGRHRSVPPMPQRVRAELAEELERRALEP